MLFLTGNFVGQSNTQNATQASLLNVGGGDQATVQLASNNAWVATENIAVGNVVFNVF